MRRVTAVADGQLVTSTDGTATARSRRARAPKQVPPASRPFLKWVGGKRQLMGHLSMLLPKQFNRYFEPFLGGGALYFHLQPERAELSDVNEQLIDTYRAVRDDVESVIRGLESLTNDERLFYTIRAIEPARLSLAARAARFIYLNRTCFNGLYRVNSRGLFNAPFGHYKSANLCDQSNLRAVATSLQRQRLTAQPFARAARRIGEGDLVYFDPPYVPVSATANFVQYARHGFGLNDQVALAAVFAKLAARGAHVMLSNSNTPLVRLLYRNFDVIEVPARRSINCLGTGRGAVTELVVVANLPQKEALGQPECPLQAN